MKYFDHTNSEVAAIRDADERRLVAALRASQIGVFEFEPETNTAFWDDRVRELWGIQSTDPITYEAIVAQVHEDDRALHDAETAKALDPDGDGHMDMMYRLYPKDGRPMRWLRAKADCFFQNGKAIRLVGTVQDITEEQTARLHNKMLLNELQHRVKNTLATAIAVVSLSRRGATDIQSYFDAVDERLRNLSLSHDLLRQSDWSPVQFTELFSNAAQSFLGPRWATDRIRLDADAFEIPAWHVMTVSMALHELMTNAAKYGALSTGSGRIEAGIRNKDRSPAFYWRETGGPKPPPRPPKAEGFGRVLLNDILPGELAGTSELVFSEGGLYYEVTMRPFKEAKT
ncbi:HWE histidine kinase domain-containing protein [uncultured Roseobacter sp.]|uniref:sensor histidine kinase n=1 Tax=uncultured Roseobacter sp. TaxID=114847 RepID=UPI00260DBAB8|nr:HWE histidine kinase domain-containing protein [uncultured Roseobacter sp.]